MKNIEALIADGGDITIGADHHVSMNMFLAKTEGAGLNVVKALGAIAPQPGCPA